MALRLKDDSIIKGISRTLIRNGIVLPAEAAEELMVLGEKNKSELHDVLQELPKKDFESIKENILPFIKLFRSTGKEEFYRTKTKLFVQKGKGLYDDYVNSFYEMLFEEKKNNNRPEERAAEERMAEERVVLTTISEEENERFSRFQKEKEYGEKKEKAKTGKEDYEIIFEYEDYLKKREVSDFVKFFNNRLEQLSRVLSGRMELANALPARRILEKKGREKISFIGIITEISETKNANIIIEAEDKTGKIVFMAHNSKKEILQKAKELVPDEVVGLKGTVGNGTVFLEDIIWPDVPYDKQLKKSNEDINAAFISDIQFGNKNFLKKEFREFIDFLNGKTEDKNLKEISEKTKYLFIVGDLVDGVGVYPNHDEDLEVKDIYKQYEGLAEYIKMIPERITVFAIPGNHDPVRMSEPQSKIQYELAKPLYEIKNFVMLTNPAMVRIGKNESFQGIDVLLYHGYSYDYYAQTVDSIRNAGGYDAPIEIMKFLLKKRHLAPTHVSSLYIPDVRKDYLVIETIPDIFASGHIHRAKAENYRNVTLLQTSCWQSITKFQEKTGHVPVLGKVFVVNLKTRKTTIIDFMREKPLKDEYGE